MLALIILLGIILALTLVYLNGIYNENYWKKRGVAFHKRNKVMGPAWDFVTQDRAFFEVIGDLYHHYANEPAVGVGSFLTPALYVRDPQNIQHVLQSDFQSFNHRAIEITEKDVLADNLLFMHGNRWKLMRQSMSPLFTATRLKNMFYIIDKSAKDFMEYLKDAPDNLKGDTLELMNMFCCAAFGGAVFGISSKSVFESPFLKMVKEALTPTPIMNLKFAIGNISVTLTKALGITIFRNHEDFFVGAIKQVLRQREKENVKKHDFADICVGLQKSGMLRDQETGLEMKPTDELLAAQAFFFFLAGVEPTATGIFSTLVELGKHPDILEKVNKEIDEIYAKHNGDITYDAVNEMEYLDKVISEALRVHPPVGFLTRQCIRDSVLPVGNIRIQKGTRIFTPLYDLHHDPKFYPKPEVFDPERFSQDTKGGEISYQPFGKGGRICIGMRYARLQMKSMIFHLLREYTVKTILDGDKIKYSKHQIQVRPSNVKVELVPLKSKRS